MDDQTETPYDAYGEVEGPEESHEGWVDRQIGPRRVGGRYRSHDSDDVYEVLAIEAGPRTSCPTWQITVRDQDGQVREHCTAWDPRDQVVAEPENELAPLLAAWDLAHRTTAEQPGWRHVLEEMAHPATTEAFHRLAGLPR